MFLVYVVNLLVLVYPDSHDVFFPFVVCVYIVAAVSFVFLKDVGVAFLQYNFTSMKYVCLIGVRKLLMLLKAFYSFHKKTLTLFKVKTDLR